ncbi:MAG: histidine triad protein [Geobacteraceae bacterium]|nr:histidine triad protein [Geobacteraceae bacterium]
MERLWAPWRMEYILNPKPGGCIFCLDDERDKDRENLVLHRSDHSFVMMNRYPYCNGHMMVSPYRHISDLEKLKSEEMLDLFAAVALCTRVLSDKFAPQGFNVGINLGKAAGAGIDDHLHLHIVPRWIGDTNYMTVIADVRVMPENILATYDKLLPGFLA